MSRSACFLAGAVAAVAGLLVLDELVYRIRSWFDVRSRPTWPPSEWT